MARSCDSYLHFGNVLVNGCNSTAFLSQTVTVLCLTVSGNPTDIKPPLLIALGRPAAE